MAIEMLTAPLEKFLETNGLAAIVIVALGLTVRSLYRRNCDLQDRRIDEQKEVRGFLEASTAAKVANTMTMDRLVDLITRGLLK